jgi:hypothetical protein
MFQALDNRALCLALRIALATKCIQISGHIPLFAQFSKWQKETDGRFRGDVGCTPDPTPER